MGHIRHYLTGRAVTRRQEVRHGQLVRSRRPSAPRLRPCPLTDRPGERCAPRAPPGHAPPAALDLLAQARAGLDEAAVLETSNERYATAHLAALRTAAAVLAARAQPEPTARRRARIRSAWEVLPEIAPELTEWSALFASGARRRARPRRASRARRPAGTPTTSYATWRCSCAWSSACSSSSRCCPSHARTRSGRGPRRVSSAPKEAGLYRCAAPPRARDQPPPARRFLTAPPAEHAA